MDLRWITYSVLSLAAPGCCSDLTAEEARRKADAFVRAEYNMQDLNLFEVHELEKSHRWEIIYSPKGEAAGGVTIIGVDKQTGQTRPLGGSQ